VTGSSLPRGRHNLTRDEVVRSQRERMLRAMAEAMAERGYAFTPVAEIIRRAGVSRETFYEQFSSKQDCFLAAYAEAVGGLGEALDAARAGEGTPVERFDRVLGIYLAALAADPNGARLFLVEVYAAGPDVARRRGETQQRFVDGLVEVFDVRSTAGRFACEALMASVISMATARVVAGDVAGLAALRAPFVELARSLFD
jgi:AcrR family transcriptional regulator